jgi:hypothetical protein
MGIRAAVVGSSRCDVLARVQRAKVIAQEDANVKSRSAPDTARGHRSAMTLPTPEFGLKTKLKSVLKPPHSPAMRDWRDGV